jgi:hypothetical protein
MEYASYIYGCDDSSFNVYDSVNILCKWGYAATKYIN